MKTAMQNPPPLHTSAAKRRVWPNHVFALVYASAILALMYHHVIISLLHSKNPIISIFMLLADMVLAYMWITYQAFRMNPIRREIFVENIPQVFKDESEYPALDVFICTADPFKEPPMVAANTALSVMAYDYPTEKLSVYVSDDGGSQLTLFALMEAALFAKHWIPYCKKNNIMERCPEAYFSSNPTRFEDTENIKLMYESMRNKVEQCVARGSVCAEYISSFSNEQWVQSFSKWTNDFSRLQHPSVIQVISSNATDKDVAGGKMPNLVYISREKSKASPSHFKAGALNVLLRVSAVMTNAPLVLVLDCDMYSNDPKTPLRALCYLSSCSTDSNVAFLQFPQRFYGIKGDDIYGADFKYIFQIDPAGMDGLLGPIHFGTGCFFRRKAFFGSPSFTLTPERPELSPDYATKNKTIQRKEALELAHKVTGCNYEAKTEWGSRMGYRYGSLVEDSYTGYHLQCLGWRSVFCNPKRAAFLGNAPVSLVDLFNQTKRWSMGLLDWAFCKYSPLRYGYKALNPLQTMCYIHYTSWPIWCIPVNVYAFLPQLALLNSLPIFPKVSDPWFLLYTFLFHGAYGQDFVDFILEGGTMKAWWNNQRMWMFRGLSSFSIGVAEYFLKSIGISVSRFDVTSKVVDGELGKRYDQGIIEFGVESPLLLGITMAGILNLLAFIHGLIRVCKFGMLEDLFGQIILAGFGMVNSWPIYEAMVLRNDKGRIPLKVVIASSALVVALYLATKVTI